MERIWLKQYPPGVPADIEPTQYASLVDLLEESFAKFADRKAFICMDKSISYRDLDQMSVALAAYLQGRGLQRGARVAIMMPNVLQYPIATAAVLRAGFAVVNVNPLYTPRELEHQLKDSGAEAIIVLENFAHTVEQVITKTSVKHVIVASMGDLLGFKGVIVNLVVRRVKKMVPAWSLPGAVSFNDALSAGRGLTFNKPKLSPGDVAFLQYTGGTTGVSKGATLLHRNIVANVLQNDAWLQPALAAPPHVDQLMIVCALPLYHIFALTACYLLAVRAGGCNLLIPNPRDIAGFVKELAKYQVNSFPAVNTLYNGLMHHPDFKKLDFSKLKISNGGGMAVQRPVAEQWKAVTGCFIAEGYGLSETSPTLTCNPATTNDFSGSIGIPVPSTYISIRDDDGNEVPLGQAGEICAKGPQVMSGYWNRPEETAKVMTADGYFRTGDIGVMDEKGYTKIVDRKKDMILVSGFNVYPNEIEEVIASHPGVLECAVIGIPDSKSGEAVKAFVVKKDQNLTAEAVIKFCHEQLTGYKVPKHIEFRTDLPKTNVGKILRRQLRDEKKAEAA
ncbi:long-chain acyl-CoA synthetase [Bradyrhizobium diazoefficiens]|jgi:long-chain acyl-CoA synthetase|uniref:Long-chain-fatty-acid--CoA ligase n=2 Tax=Bradyrhizobium diazoefficiens TaxID=1355477 RepID=Q89UU0_BRADU|nr:MULTISPECIES: long-chain fatty acid--CoA ligase [Bradyrhizobium]MBP1059913.1 long-chain acyl-CoA synthetase [Bradyrhizobium japonicum]AND86990.1 long-chain fatty acid--CoA ligase [Bradyrhizobium diazoefficiens USDA 110]APO49935.1 long-chain fatty acid--CoA ligase [Bradyrhizobium diazoefficiens]AWO88472.1 long-chain fatty acid--CoA ligase [Bradyrhizobium diazoefficiens]KGJ65777.1 putative acyl-CoA synthase [Bradyrhizobium diazoefficiens SEMIA 5080]